MKKRMWIQTQASAPPVPSINKFSSRIKKQTIKYYLQFNDNIIMKLINLTKQRLAAVAPIVRALHFIVE